MKTPSRPARSVTLLATAAAAAVAVAVVLSGCTGASDEPAASATASSSASASASEPEADAAPTEGEEQGPQPERELTQAGITVTVPPGWDAAVLDEASRQQAVAAQEDPRVAEFLGTRLQGMAETGGVMYLYDLRALDQGVLSAVEVYRYAGTDPQAVAEQNIVPVMAQAGLEPEVGTAELPAGTAVTVTGRVQGEGVSLTNEVAVLTLGPSVVSLSATFADPTADEVQAVLASVREA